MGSIPSFPIVAQILRQDLPVVLAPQKPVAKPGCPPGTAIEFQYLFDGEVALQTVDDRGLDARPVPGTRARELAEFGSLKLLDPFA